LATSPRLKAVPEQRRPQRLEQVDNTQVSTTFFGRRVVDQRPADSVRANKA
jgi:hypothetical protein